MATLSIELPDSMLEFVDQEIQAGRFKDRSTLVQMLIGEAMRSMPLLKPEQVKRFAALVQEAEEQVERGECKDWNAAESRKLLAERIALHNAKVAT